MTAAPLIAIGTFGTAFAQWFIVLLFARSFGAEAVGQYSALYAIATPTFVVAQFGLRDIHLTLNPGAPRHIFTMLRFGGIVAGAITLYVAAAIVALPPDLVLAMVALKAAESFLDLRYAFVQKSARLHRLGWLMIANFVLSVGAVTTVAATGGPMVGAVLAAAAASTLVALADLAQTTPERGPATATARDVLRAGLPVTVAQATFSLVSYAPIWIVALYGTTSEVGAFTGAAYLIVFANLVGATAQTVLLPSWAARRHDPAALLSSARSIFLRISALALGGVVIAVAFGPAFLAAVYGADFRLERGVVLPIALAAAVVMPTYVLNALLLILNAYRSGAVAALAALVATLGAGILLGPTGGITAAAWAAFGGSCARLVVSELRVRSRAAHTDRTTAA